LASPSEHLDARVAHIATCIKTWMSVKITQLFNVWVGVHVKVESSECTSECKEPGSPTPIPADWKTASYFFSTLAVVAVKGCFASF